MSRPTGPALWQAASEPLRDAMDLALLTGQRPADVLKMARTDVRDGFLHLRQGKTGRALRIIVEGELATVIERCISRARAARVTHLRLVVGERGQPLSYRSLAAAFDAARSASGIEFVQFRDIRAKTASDIDDLESAPKLLAHRGVKMTEHYRRDRAGDKVRPLR